MAGLYSNFNFTPGVRTDLTPGMNYNMPGVNMQWSPDRQGDPGAGSASTAPRQVNFNFSDPNVQSDYLRTLGSGNYGYANGTGQLKDPNAVINDPYFGQLTSVNNMNQHGGFMGSLETGLGNLADKVAPIAQTAALGAIGYGALSGLGILGNTAGAGAAAAGGNSGGTMAGLTSEGMGTGFGSGGITNPFAVAADPTGLSNLPTFTDLGNYAGGTSTAGSSGLSNLLSSKLLGNLGVGNALGGALGYVSGQQQANGLMGLSQNIMNRADPFYSQQPFYQGQLQQLMTNPSQYLKPFTQGAYDLAADAAMRTGAARGSFSSSTTNSDLMDLATKMMSSNALQFGSLLGNLGGANVQPGYGLMAASNASQSGLQQQAQSNNNITGMISQAASGSGGLLNTAYNAISQLFS
jgi:hypothetical protein